MSDSFYAFAVTYKENGTVRLEPYNYVDATKLFGRKGIMTPPFAYEIDSDGLFTGEVILTKDFLFDKSTPIEQLISYRKPVVSKGDLITVRPSNIRYSHNDPRDSISLSFEIPDYMAFPNMVVIKNTDPTKLKRMGSRISCKVIAPLRPKNENAKGYVIISDIDGGDKNWGFDNVYIEGKKQENYLPTGNEIFFGEMNILKHGGKLYNKQSSSDCEITLDDLTNGFSSISKVKKVVVLNKEEYGEQISIHTIDEGGIKQTYSSEYTGLIKLKLSNHLSPSTRPTELPVVIINEKFKTELSDIVHDLGHPVFKLG